MEAAFSKRERLAAHPAGSWPCGQKEELRWLDSVVTFCVKTKVMGLCGQEQT